MDVWWSLPRVFVATGSYRSLTVSMALLCAVSGDGNVDLVVATARGKVMWCVHEQSIVWCRCVVMCQVLFEDGGVLWLVA